MTQFAWRMVAGGLALTTALLVATGLGLETLGVVATSMSVVLALSVLTGAGFSHAVSFMAAREPSRAGRTTDRALGLSLAASAVAGVAVAVVGPVVLPALPVLWGHAAVALAFVQVGQLSLGLHQGLASHRAYVITYIAQPLAAFAVAVLAAALSRAADVDADWAGALVVLPFVAQAATFVPAWLELPRDRPAEPVRALLAYTARIYPSVVAHYLSYRVDLLIVGGLLGATAAGIYSLALNGVDAVARIGQAAATVLFPRFASMPDASAARRLVLRAAQVSGGLGLFASVALAAGVTAAGAALGPEVRTIGGLLTILTIAGGSVSAWGIIASYLAARDRLAAAAWINLALLVTSVALYLALIPAIGLSGAAIGTSAGLLVAALLGYREVRTRAPDGGQVNVPTSTLPSFEVRGRHLLAADALLSATSMTLAWSVSGMSVSVWGAAIVIALRAGFAMAGRAYQQARAFDTRVELVRLVVAVAAASTVAYAFVMRERLSDAGIARTAIAESLVAIVLLVVLRPALAAAGAGRRREIRTASHDALPPLPRELDAMIDALRVAPAVYQPSRFWEGLNRRHLAALASDQGFARFKRTVNTSYFQFGAPGFWRSLPVLLLEWVRRPLPSVFGARMATGPARRGLAILIALYANAVARRPHGGLMKLAVEPAVGDPLLVRFGGAAVTEDLCHSVEEFDTVNGALPMSLRPRRVLELGAGYGRLAYVWASARPGLQYFVVDIPPALYLSQRYLREVFPDAVVFPFRPFTAYADVADEMSRARLVFLEPQQLELVPNDHIDLFMTVSTLHEMRPDQVERYLALADRLCSGAFYTKQWRSFYNDVDGTTLTRDTYSVPARWSLLLERTPLVPRSFFEALYLCRR